MKVIILNLLACLVVIVSGALVIPMGLEHAPQMLWIILIASMVAMALFSTYTTEPNWFLFAVVIVFALIFSAHLNRTDWVLFVAAAAVARIVLQARPNKRSNHHAPAS